MPENNGGNVTALPVNIGGRKEAKNLVDAISEIQVLSVAESHGLNLDKNFFTWQMNIEFFGIGFKAFLAGFIISLFLLPLAVAVCFNIVPVYGGAANLYDKCFMFVLAFCVSFGAVIILASAAKYTFGQITYQMNKALYIGGIIASLLKGTVLFFIFQYVQIVNMGEMFNKIAPFIQIDSVIALMPVFRVCSVLIVIYSLVAILVLSLCGFKAFRKFKKNAFISGYIENG